MYSLIIKNATVIDGTGANPYPSDIGIEGENIVQISKSINSAAHKVIDAQGLVISPGFIDIQNHSDSYWQLFDNPDLESLRLQGITTILVGQCGASLAPLVSRRSLESFKKWHSLDGINVNWATFAELSKTLNSLNLGCNIASLTGFNTLKDGILSDPSLKLSEAEHKMLLALFDQSMEEGSYGLSINLEPEDNFSLNSSELLDFIEKNVGYNGLLSIHIKSISDSILENLDELLESLKGKNLRIKISHLKILKSQDNHIFEAVIEKIETARHQGMNIWFDVYPYTTLWQGVSQYLPGWIKISGRKHLLAQLKDPQNRKKVLEFLHNSKTDLQNLVIASTNNNLNVLGRKLSQLAKDLNITTEEALLMLAEQNEADILVFDESLKEDEVTRLLMHPLSLISTDGAGFPGPQDIVAGQLNNKMIHPRCFGSFPKFLKIVRETNSISLSEAVAKITSVPAGVIGLTDRGVIAIGKKADLVIFNPSSISDSATLNQPYLPPKGISYVINNGELTIENSVLLKNTSGKFLEKK